MEQETTQGDIPGIDGGEFKSPPKEPLVIVQEHLVKITEAIRENTVALVEMGIIVQRLENRIDNLSRKGV